MQTKEISLSLLAFFYRFTYPPFDRFDEPHRMGKKGQKKKY
jgi:hypothetical protein